MEINHCGMKWVVTCKLTCSNQCCPGSVFVGYSVCAGNLESSDVCIRTKGTSAVKMFSFLSEASGDPRLLSVFDMLKLHWPNN